MSIRAIVLDLVHDVASAGAIVLFVATVCVWLELAA